MAGPRRDVAGLVLAGGRGRRMGGRDKAFLMLGGTPLIGHAVARLAPQVDAVAISANRAADANASLGLPVLPDVVGSGPLAGLLAGLLWARAEGFAAVQTVAVDTPFFPRDLVSRLADAAAGGVAVARSDGRVHPVFAFVPVGLAEGLARHLDAGGSLRAAAWVAAHDPVGVDFDDAEGDPFFNINAPEDLASAVRRVEEGAGEG